MGKIILKNIRIFAFHGCLVEESKIGSDYLVNLTVNTDLNTSAVSDNLYDTVDYVHLNQIIKEEMAIRSALLEHVAKRILDRIFIEANTVTYAEVSVSKLNPPIGGDVEAVTIVMEKSV
jgi:7,8-dihydroneopterin aldolase/epimerase/oxygenase